MALRNQPTEEYLLALAGRALALHHEWMADATPIQKMVANGGSHFLTIERAAEWPFTAIARCGWFVAPEMQDKAETGTKFFVKGKANVGAPMPGTHL